MLAVPVFRMRFVQAKSLMFTHSVPRQVREATGTTYRCPDCPQLYGEFQGLMAHLASKHGRVAAPLGSVRIFAANSNAYAKRNFRLRRRGPRSDPALTRRASYGRRHGGTPADAISGESEYNATVSDSCNNSQSFVMYCINIRCALSNLAELCYQVKVMAPHLILLQET